MLFWLTVAFAYSPIPVQGTLSGTDGEPLEGSHQVQLSLYASETDPSADHQETLTVAFRGGAFAAWLGAASDPPAALWTSTSGVWLGLSVDGSPESGRVQVGFAPLALYAREAGHAASATTATSATQAATAGDVTCVGCVSADDLAPGAGFTGLTLAGSSGLSGAGTTGAPLSLGTSGVTAGSYTLANITVDAWGRVTSAASGSAAGTATQFGDDASACDAGKLGTIRFRSGGFEGCTSGGWLSLGGGSPSQTPTAAGASCAAIELANPSAPSGLYFIDPNGAPTSDAMRVYCDFVGDYTWPLWYRDDNAINDLPDAASTIANGFYNTNAHYIGNAQLNALAFESADWCVTDGTTTYCFPIDDAQWSYTGAGLGSMIGMQRRIIAAFSGQVDDGNTEEGVNGAFYAWRSGANPPVCTAYPNNPAHGHIQQWVGSDANWHTWGNGLSLYRDGANAFGANNEIAWGRENLAAGACGAELWETFYVRVKPVFAGAAAGTNRVSPAASCAAVRVANGSAPSGFYWIDANGGAADDAGKAWCDFAGGWTEVVRYVDDNAKNDLPDVPGYVAGGFFTENSAYIGNTQLNALAFTQMQVCYASTSQEFCFPVADADFTYTGTEVNALTGGRRRIAGALSGQVPPGRTIDGANGDFQASRLQGAPPICPGLVNTAHGHTRQWSGSDASWHVWGHGLSMYLDGSNSYGVNNEITWGRETQASNYCGAELYERFSVRVK